ncbi:MAG TPA: hypothetical protein VH640_00770 [Bryobacteraceae bacterium]
MRPRFPWISLPVFIAALAIHTASAQIQVLAVTDAATFTPGLPFAGSLATVFCKGLTGITGVQAAASYPLPDQIAGVSVTINGTGAPLLAVANSGGYQQINIQVPPLPGLSGIFGPQTIQVTQSGHSGSITFQWPSTWGVFFAGSSGYVAAQHADYSAVTPDHPARPGEVLTVYATNLVGVGDISNAPPIGSAAQESPLATVPLSVHTQDENLVRGVSINGTSAAISYLGLTPGAAGVFQINLQVPENTPDGDAIVMASSCGGVCLSTSACGSNLSQCTYSRPAKLPVRAGQ